MSDNKNITDTELDALFKNADAAGAVPAFDEAFWTEMEGMLPAKKRRGVIFWWTSGAALVAGIALFIGISQLNRERSLAGRGEHVPTRTENQENISSDERAVTPIEDKEASVEMPSMASVPNKVRENVQQPDLNDIQNQDAVNQTNSDLSQNKLDNTVSKTETPVLDEVNLSARDFVFTAPVVLNDVYVDRSTTSGLPVYTEFAVGYGQSYKRIAFSNNWATQFRFTVGLTKEVPGMQLSAGLALRAEMPNNLSYVRTENGSNGVNTSVSEYRGLYSVEFPMEALGKFGRNGLGLLFVPGIQLGYTGNKSFYQNADLISRERASGNIESAKTMTMECGLKYAYNISEHLQFTSSCTFDMVRPFQSSYYQGDNQDYPVTFFVGLRKKF